MKKLTIAALVLLGVTSTAQAAGDAAAGQTKAAVCAACHGVDGNKTLMPVYPKLAGQHAGYIAKQLAEFKGSVRKDPVMSGMAAPLSEQDMADLAAYFSSQARDIGSANAELAAKGEQIFRGGIAEKGVSACMACHGPSGAGNPAANYPGIAGQNAAYAEKTLKDFRSGTRANDPAKMMQMVVNRMTDDEIKAVAEYLAGLH